MRSTSRRRFLFAAGAGAALAAFDPVDPRKNAVADLEAGRPQAEDRSAFHKITRTTHALGSEISVTVFHRSDEAADRAIDAAFAELETVAGVMSLYREESQLCRLNKNGNLAQPHPYLVSVLRKAREISRRSGGAFDVTVQPLWESYTEAKANGRLPDVADLKVARRRVGWRDIEVSGGRVRLRRPEMAVTLNGIAQGFAADRLMAALRRHGVEHALVNTGEIGAVGRKPGGEAWKVGIQHPRRPDAYVSLATLSGRCMATSGDYETAFSTDRAYNHIFDPATGRSPRAFSSVTVLAPTGIEADALSTAVFVLGPERGLEFLKGLPGIDAFLVLKDEGILTTDGFPRAA